MMSRALLNKAKSQVMPYNSRKGAYKIVESEAYQSLHGQVAIVNESSQSIEEDLIFHTLTGFQLIGAQGNQVKVVC